MCVALKQLCCAHLQFEYEQSELCIKLERLHANTLTAFRTLVIYDFLLMPVSFTALGVVRSSKYFTFSAANSSMTSLVI